jgi:hypothetical protein
MAAEPQQEKEKELYTEESADVAQKELRLVELVKKKSLFDMQVQFGNEYLALTDLGASMLHDLNIRNYRVGDAEFSGFVVECRATTDALQAIARRAGFYFANIRPVVSSLACSDEDEEYYGDEEIWRIKLRARDSQVWAVSIGLAKLQTDNESELKDKYLRTLNSLEGIRLESNLDSKVIAAEIIALSDMAPSEEQVQSLEDFDEQLRVYTKVPWELSIRVAATILCGGGSIDKFEELAKATKSHQAAAMLSTIDIPSDQLRARFESFKSVFDSWGFSESEDTDLAAAYLSMTKLTADFIAGGDPQAKTITIVNGIMNDLEYPLLPAAILTMITALSAREVLDLMEKGVEILRSVAPDLQRSELMSLAVRLVYGQLELNKLAETPIEFTMRRVTPQDEKAEGTRSEEGREERGTIFLFRGGYYGGYYYPRYYYPIIVAHSSYHSRYHGMGSPHPGHWHGVGGFAG